MSKNIFILVFGAVLVGLFASDAFAHSVNYRLCARARATYTDNGFGEDAWTGDSNRNLRDIRMRVRHYPSCNGTGSYTNIWSGYANNSGCSAQFTTSEHDCFSVEVWTYGRPGTDNSLYAYSSSGSVRYYKINRANPPNSSGSHYFTFSETDELRMYTTYAQIIDAEFQGNMTGDTIRVYNSTSSATCGCSGSGTRACEVNSSTGNICLDSTARGRKNTMAHEYGHINLFLSTSNSMSNDCSLGGSGHDWDTREYMSCAMQEGWANFVAFDVWNDHDENSNPNAYVHTWGSCDMAGFNNPKPNCPPNDSGGNESVINGEGEGCDYECDVKFMESYWGSSSWPGRGTEVDWARTYWDYHTNDPGRHGVWPSHARMQSEFNASGSMGQSNSYDKLRKGVAAYSGCNQYKRFVYYAAANGADHCSGSCDDVPGCTDCDASGCP